VEWFLPLVVREAAFAVHVADAFIHLQVALYFVLQCVAVCVAECVEVVREAAVAVRRWQCMLRMSSSTCIAPYCALECVAVCVAECVAVVREAAVAVHVDDVFIHLQVAV